MEKVRRCIKFDKNYLSSLKEDSHACVEVIKNIRHLSLHPFHLSDVNYSIKEILGEQIGKYDKKLNGILLSFQNIKLLRSIGSISFDSSFTHIDIEAEYFVFKPEVGKVLRGVVNKKSKDHVGCLVHKFFNVSLPRPPNCENWLGSVLQIGHEIEFRITFTNLEARLPYIKAEIISLLSEDSGISTGEEGNNHAVNTITKFETDELVDDAVSSSQKKSRKRKFVECTSSHDDDDDEAESSHRKHKKRKRSKSKNETSYTLTGILNYTQEEEEEGGGETSKKKKTSGEKDNDEENKKRGKKSRKSKHVTVVNHEDKHNSAVSDEAVSKNRKMKRKISDLDDSFTSKKRKVDAQVEEVGLQEENSTRKVKHKNAPNVVSDTKDKTKQKNGTLSDLNLSEIFNETFTDRKPKNKKKRKVDVENGTLSDLDLSEILNETFTVTKSKNTKQQKVHAEVITEKELVNKKKKRSSELNPNDSLLRRPDSSMEKSKKRKKENSGSDLLGLNFDDIINESVVQEMSSKSERKRRSKSQPRCVEANESISKSEKRRSKSQIRDVETNLATELFPPQIDEAKSKKKKKRDSDLSQIDFEENSRKSISPIISQRENTRSKSQPRQVEENPGISKSEKKRSKSQVRETNLARELFPSQIDKSEESKSNKKKKKRDSDLSISQINFEGIINESAVEVNDAKSKKSRKKKLKKSKDEKDMDVSLPELNLDQLFSEGVNKRNSSHGNSSWQDKTFELPSDSDMENIFSSCFPKSNHKSKKKT